MTENLYLRLGSQASDPINWLIADAQHKEIIASGELPGADHLHQLTEKAKGRTLITLVNANAVKLTALKVPGRSRRAMEQAAPYMLEDELAEDVDDLFFAFADKPRDHQGEENCFLAAVQRDQLNSWLSWLAEAKLFCQVMLPDVLALPLHSGSDENSHWSALSFDRELLLRQGAWQGCALDHNLCQPYFAQLAPMLIAENNTEADELSAIHLHHYSPMTPDDLRPIAAVELHRETEELPLFVLAKGMLKQSFNLLQGEFQVKKLRSQHSRNWLLVAAIAALALLLNLTGKGLSLMQLNAEQERVNQQIVATYKKAFPRTKRVQVTLLRSQIKRKLQEYSGAGGDQGFLMMLDDIRPAFIAHKSIKPQALKYDGKRGEIRLNVAAENYLAFDRFKSSLEQAKLVVSTGAQNNQGDEVTGSFTIRYN